MRGIRQWMSDHKEVAGILVFLLIIIVIGGASYGISYAAGGHSKKQNISAPSSGAGTLEAAGVSGEDGQTEPPSVPSGGDGPAVEPVMPEGSSESPSQPVCPPDRKRTDRARKRTGRGKQRSAAAYRRKRSAFGRLLHHRTWRPFSDCGRAGNGADRDKPPKSSQHGKG